MVIDASGGKKVEVRVEIADDLFEQQRGLMYRTALGEDRGMLFVYRREQRLSFWMKNTLIPLSIAYIDSEGASRTSSNMKPLDDKPPHYVSSEPVQYALEVNQGFFDERGVKVGDHAELPGVGNTVPLFRAGSSRLRSRAVCGGRRSSRPQGGRPPRSRSASATRKGSEATTEAA